METATVIISARLPGSIPTCMSRMMTILMSGSVCNSSNIHPWSGPCRVQHPNQSAYISGELQSTSPTIRYSMRRRSGDVLNCSASVGLLPMRRSPHPVLAPASEVLQKDWEFIDGKQQKKCPSLLVLVFESRHVAVQRVAFVTD